MNQRYDLRYMNLEHSHTKMGGCMMAGFRTVGDNVKRLVYQQGVGCNELAKCIGLLENDSLRFLKDRKAIPSSKILQSAMCLNTDLMCLLDEDGEHYVWIGYMNCFSDQNNEDRDRVLGVINSYCIFKRFTVIKNEIIRAPFEGP